MLIKDKMSARTINSFNVTVISASNSIKLTWNSNAAAFGATNPINWWTLKSTDLTTLTENILNITLYDGSGVPTAGGNATYNGEIINNTGTITQFTVFNATLNYLNLIQAHNVTFSVIGKSTIYPSGNAQYTNNVTSASSYLVPTLPQVPCLLEGTLIMCADGIKRPIESLTKGVMVKTFEHGDIAIDIVGKSVLHHKRSNDQRDQLFVYKKEALNLSNDLVLTGGHSSLVDSLTVHQVKDVLKVMGNIFMTDTKFRLPACLDDRAIPYEKEDEVVTIYHICLTDENPEKNYGVYANDMLVETCHKECVEKMDSHQ